MFRAIEFCPFLSQISLQVTFTSTDWWLKPVEV